MPTSNPGRKEPETFFLWRRMTASRWRLIEPRTFEARLETSPATFCLRSLFRNEPVETFCFLCCGISSCVSSPSKRQTISKCNLRAQGQGKNKKFFPQIGERKKRSAIVPMCRTDFFKTFASCGWTSFNPMTSRQADGMDAKSGTRSHTEPTPRRFEKTTLYCPAVVRWRTWCSQSWGSLCQTRIQTIRLSTEIALILKSQCLSTKLWGETFIFNTRCMIFSGVSSNDECNHLGRSLFQIIWRIWHFASHGTPHNSQITNSHKDSRFSPPCWSQQHLR